MAGVAEDVVLPVYAAQKHSPLQATSLRRRRFTVSLFTCISLFTLLYWGHRLFIRQPVISEPLLYEDPRPTVALTSLGLEAEQVYHLGSLSRPYYRSSLQSFLSMAFPSPLRPQLSKSLHRFLDFNSTEPPPERPKIIWQTNDVRPQNKQTQSWQDRNQDHEYRYLNDQDADAWVKKTFKGSPIEWTWNFLPHPVMKADFLRYLLLLVEGGVYSDIDTTCLKPARDWGADPDIRRQPAEGPPSAIVGVEADVGERADWHKWWSRPIQIVQWTMASAPGHPVLLDTVHRVYQKSVEAERMLLSDPSLTKESILDKDMTVLEWTGPAVFTDATLRFLRIDSDLKWPDLRGLTKPLRAGSVTILPVTGFSPGVKNFGAKEKDDKQAMVHHDFGGSWKPKKGTKGQKQRTR